YGHEPATRRRQGTIAAPSYAYRPPRQVAEHLNTLADDGQAASSYLASTVFPNPDYAWNEETDQAVRLCPACGEVVGDIHPCPGPADAPYSDPVLVNLAIGDEIVTPEIGRASCRAGVELRGGDGSFKKKKKARRAR